MPAIKSKGFTLVELVVGLVVFAIAMTLFVSLIVPQAIRSVDPIFQVRAAELAQSLVNEISSKPFDQNSSRIGGTIRCNEAGNPCTQSQNLGPEENRSAFNDVDDYHGLLATGTDFKQNSLGGNISIDGKNLYAGFSLAVTVFYDDNLDGIDDSVVGGGTYVGNTKYIKVIVTTPNDEDITFATYRSNY
ncbi:prepilin-type N-terminal cleavage/methylation domain-containing protein [Paraglaciecola aquimarina]|uniref:Prepilin-type N-terminal cleavage/methylation domain-containing protein n=1 Tax=Paraglaciecola aquimarina TaxID=1235557 RepID=A0ABU3ST09_9ALTE|nr:prepilin-type N-terminal cleavage/methylation domain-containing protein [Paraglaciecola aquimarina]MDU0353118.1 prepilin-type N-terminal cleavage/methylation domain-containing protein [Paraglaciecola aquimarina]